MLFIVIISKRHGRPRSDKVVILFFCFCMFFSLTGFISLFIIYYFFLVHGSWSSWSGWTSCSHVCGTGSQERSRSCSRPAPSNGGRYCQGSAREKQLCNKQLCPSKNYVKLSSLFFFSVNVIKMESKKMASLFVLFALNLSFTHNFVITLASFSSLDT